MKAPPAKSPAERRTHTTGAAPRGGGVAPPPTGLEPSLPRSSPSDSVSRLAAIFSVSWPSSPLCYLVIVYRLVRPGGRRPGDQAQGFVPKLGVGRTDLTRGSGIPPLISWAWLGCFTWAQVPNQTRLKFFFSFSRLIIVAHTLKQNRNS